MSRIEHFFRWVENPRNPITLLFVLVMVTMIGGFVIVQDNANRIERESMFRANETCHAVNESRIVLGSVLDALVVGHPDSTEEEIARRQILRDQLAPLIELAECPPRPE
jgi:hypothetical protein